MKITELYSELKKIEAIIDARGLRAECVVRINWCGEELSFSVRANEPHEEIGFWSNQREFTGHHDEAERILKEAHAWVAQLPDEEDRAIELMIRKITKLVGKASTTCSWPRWITLQKMDCQALPAFPNPGHRR